MEQTYPDFAYRASELSAYYFSAGIFTISLKNGEIKHYIAIDEKAFKKWLDGHKVRDIDAPM